MRVAQAMVQYAGLGWRVSHAVGVKGVGMVTIDPRARQCEC